MPRNFRAVGLEYELTRDDQIQVHVYGRAAERTDMEVRHEPTMIVVWIAAEDYRAWNSAGTQLNV